MFVLTVTKSLSCYGYLLLNIIIFAKRYFVCVFYTHEIFLGKLNESLVWRNPLSKTSC